MRVRLRLNDQGREAADPDRGFTLARDAADTIGEGHAEAGHDQSGNVGGSTVPRFENPNRPARQAVPPLRQARRVLHALYLEAAGQPGTAPRPLLPVPPRGARRFAELPRPRLVGRTTAFSRGTTVGQAVTSASPAAAPPAQVGPAQVVLVGDASVRRRRHARRPVGGSRRPGRGASRWPPPSRPWCRLRTIGPLGNGNTRHG